MTVLTAEEVEKRFGCTPEQLDKMEADATAGVFHGEPSGPVVYHRHPRSAAGNETVGISSPSGR